MKRRGNAFGPFAAAAAVLLLAAAILIESDPPQQRAVERADLTKGSKHQPQRQQASRPREALIVPVAGVARADLADTWGQGRAEGRMHQGIDILAPMGSSVVAAADGRVVKFFDSVRGGVTVYQFDTSERFVFYYAHLNARAPGLREGDRVRQGEVIGYVGMSGNAPAPHLHFEIQRLGPERQWWRATSVNPYPYLLAGRAPA